MVRASFDNNFGGNYMAAANNFLVAGKLVDKLADKPVGNKRVVGKPVKCIGYSGASYSVHVYH